MTNSTYPTLQEIRDTHAWKREYERYLPLSRFVFRPMGFLLTWLAIRIGLTSEVVSWLSGLIGLIAYLCLLSSHEQLLSVGIGLLCFFNLLDCVDGSIARTMKTENPYGRFLDSLMGWIDMGFWALIGVMAYRHTQLLYWPDPFGKGVIVWLVIGGLTSYFFILAGYIEGLFDGYLRADWDKLVNKQKSDILKNEVTKNGNTSPSFILNIIRRINHNLRVRETHYFLLVFAYCGKVIDLLLGLFLLYYFLHTIFLIIVYSSRGRCLLKSVYKHHDNL
jgi:hypothetical protein